MKLTFWTWQMLNIPSCCLLHTKLYLCNRDLGYLVQLFRQYNSALMEEACGRENLFLFVYMGKSQL